MVAGCSSRPDRRSISSATWLESVAVLKGTTTETRLNDLLRLLQISATVVTVADANGGLARCLRRAAC